MNDYIRSLIIGVVEGLTEFLPVSSTAHIRITQELLGIDMQSGYWKMFAIVIQLGAILSVVLYFWKRLLKFLSTFPKGESGDRTVWNHPVSLVLIAFVVTAGPCYLMDKLISENLEHLTFIAIALLVGGVIMWVVDAWAGARERRLANGASSGAAEPAPAGQILRYATPEKAGLTTSVERMTLVQAVLIGAAQILSAAFPGTSRSMATIAAGQLAGLTRVAALEFSFFLAIPVMVAATLFKLLQFVRKTPVAMTGEQWGVLAVGFVVSFVVALACIHWFMGWVRKRGFVPFAVYRIAVGAGLLAWVLAR